MPNQLPSVSIVTPSYNQGPYIEATIRSVLDQAYPNLQYIVMDGASTDSTVGVLRRYQDRLQWVSEPDKGQSDAINKGFARTSGEILGWLNSDDTYEPGAIHAAAEYLHAHPEVDIIYGDADFIDERGRYICPCAHIEPYNRHRLFYYSDFIVQPAAFFRRRAFEAVGGIDAALHWAMDYDLWLNLARGHRFAYLPRLMAHYRWLGSNKSGVGGSVRVEEIRQIMRRHGVEELPAYVCLEKVAMHLNQALQASKQARLPQVLSCVATATATLLSSRRAVGSLLSPHTWNIIWMGQVLRRRAALLNARNS